MRALLRMACCAWGLAATVACAGTADGGDAAEQAALDRAALTAGVARSALVPDLRAFTPAPGSIAPPALLRALQAAPLQASDQARALRAGFAAAGRQPAALWARTAALHVPDIVPSGSSARSPVSTGPACGADPLAGALQRIWRLAGQPWSDLVLPADRQAERPLRAAVADMLHAIADAEIARRAALAGVPAELSPAVLLGLLPGESSSPEHETLVRRAASAVDRVALTQGMQALVDAAGRLVQALSGAAATARVAWQWSTPWGEVRIDTTGTDREHRLLDPLLVVDAGGNDRYVFTGRTQTNRIAVLLDLDGDDRYEAAAPCSDAACGLLGYGLLWDTDGDDQYQGGWLAQGAAVFGAALLVDATGHDRYDAKGMAQGFGWAGAALLADLGGNDHYVASTHAQASAGPGATAVLLDTHGDDRYLLRAAPVVLRSSQLPDRNSSMGQGVGRGLWATAQAPAIAGGTGVLLDLAGDDHYSAQVFAQGSGYYFGVGLLVDGQGNDRFDAAWYAMGAAAHVGAGVLLKEGQGDDRYNASHSTSLGAAHDGALAYFRDDGGDDHYRLGNLGWGAAQEVSVAVFVDAGGNDRYEGAGPPCNALGLARHSAEGLGLPDGMGLGLFLDLAGRNHYPVSCPQARGGRTWGGEAARTGMGIGVDAGEPATDE